MEKNRNLTPFNAAFFFVILIRNTFVFIMTPLERVKNYMHMFRQIQEKSTTKTHTQVCSELATNLHFIPCLRAAEIACILHQCSLFFRNCATVSQQQDMPAFIKNSLFE